MIKEITRHSPFAVSDAGGQLGGVCFFVAYTGNDGVTNEILMQIPRKVIEDRRGWDSSKSLLERVNMNFAEVFNASHNRVIRGAAPDHGGHKTNDYVAYVVCEEDFY